MTSAANLSPVALFLFPLACVLLTAAVVTGPGSASAAESGHVEQAAFGSTRDGQPVTMYTLTNAKGLRAKVITYGAILYSLEIPDKDGKLINVTANRETVADYEKKSACFGAVLGRYANRIGGAKFSIDGKSYAVTPNAGKNHIHGGAKGFDKRVWKGEITGAGVKLSYTSADGEEGFPGQVICTITYELTDDNELKLHYTGKTDKPTVLNMSNHAYWNLAGAYSGDMLDHVLTLNADKYLLVDESLIPTGQFAEVANTPLDFRSPHAVGERIGQIKEKQFNGGYDHCMVVNQHKPGELTFCARLKDPKSGRTMEVWTTEPGVQVYSANFGAGAFEGPGGYAYPRHLGLALETQHFPDSPNKPHFPSTVLRPGQNFESTTVYKFN